RTARHGIRELAASERRRRSHSQAVRGRCEMTWLGRRLPRRRAEKQLSQELEFHVEEYADDLIARGVDPVEARRRALLEFGGVEQVKEVCRDARGPRWGEDIPRDPRIA